MQIFIEILLERFFRGPQSRYSPLKLETVLSQHR